MIDGPTTPPPQQIPQAVLIQQAAAEERQRQEEMITEVMKEEVERSEEIGKLAAALSKAQGKITAASRDSKNPFFKSSYASIAAVWEACREALSENNLAVIQLPNTRGAWVVITTILLHESGEWIQSKLSMKAKGDTAQEIGSVITYARRYALASMVGVAPADDDGEAGTRSAPPAGVKWDKGNSGLQPATIPATDELAEAPIGEVSAAETASRPEDPTVRLEPSATTAASIPAPVGTGPVGRPALGPAGAVGPVASGIAKPIQRVKLTIPAGGARGGGEGQGGGSAAAQQQPAPELAGGSSTPPPPGKPPMAVPE